MARIIPGSWPLGLPDGVIMPGLGHYDEHVEDLVEAQHMLYADWGRAHCGQQFAAAAVREIAGVLTQYLTYLIVPRAGMTTLRVLAILDGGSAGGTLRIRDEDTPTNLDIAVPAGAFPVYIPAGAAAAPTLVLNRPDTLTRITVWLEMAGGGDLIDLRAIYLLDDDLAAI